MGNVHGVNVKRIWNYLPRTLTGADNITSDGNPINQDKINNLDVAVSTRMSNQYENKLSNLDKLDVAVSSRMSNQYESKLAKLDRLDVAVSTRSCHSVEDVWNYSNRTLTQDHFPFWTEVILHTKYQSQLSAESSVICDLRPPSGETWLIFYHASIKTCSPASYVYVNHKENNISKTVAWIYTSGCNGISYPFAVGGCVINNTYHIRFGYHNDYTSSVFYAYSYSGFKLGTKLAEFEEMETVKSIQRERLTKYKIKSEFEGLEDLIRDVYDDTTDDYKQVIYFYKDKPIRKDKATGHIIEKASSYIETDKLIENLGKVKTEELKLEKTGYKEWLDRIKIERGIDLLGRL